MTADRSSLSFSFFDGNALFPDIGEDRLKLGFGAVIDAVGFLTAISEIEYHVILVGKISFSDIISIKPRFEYL